MDGLFFIVAGVYITKQEAKRRIIYVDFRHVDVPVIPPSRVFLSKHNEQQHRKEQSPEGSFGLESGPAQLETKETCSTKYNPDRYPKQNPKKARDPVKLPVSIVHGELSQTLRW